VNLNKKYISKDIISKVICVVFKPGIFDNYCIGNKPIANAKIVPLGVIND
jgi:hypothetical protein